MIYTLCNKDHEALRFDLDEPFVEVLDNKYLPYPLKDYIKTTGSKNLKGSVDDISVTREYLAGRTLNLSRENAKTILNVTALPQSLKTDDKLKIVLACRGLVMQDNFWLRKEGETLSFADVCLRHHRLSDKSYDVAILGKHISATSDELIPDLTTEGMFPKYWHRTEDGRVELWKTDRQKGLSNSVYEIQASDILDRLDYPHVEYRKKEKDGIVFSVCDCMADDELSFVPIQDIMDWHTHTGYKFPKLIRPVYDKYLPDMCVLDYALANTDRHTGNWGVMVNSENDIVSMAPMFDLNQALVADVFGTNVSDQLYEPTGITFTESIDKYAHESTIDFAKLTGIPEKIKKRIEDIENAKAITRNEDFVL